MIGPPPPSPCAMGAGELGGVLQFAEQAGHGAWNGDAFPSGDADWRGFG